MFHLAPLLRFMSRRITAVLSVGAAVLLCAGGAVVLRATPASAPVWPAPSVVHGTKATVAHSHAAGVTDTPEATAAPEPTDVPKPTDTPEATAAPEPTDVPEPSDTPDATAAPEPTDAPDQGSAGQSRQGT